MQKDALVQRVILGVAKQFGRSETIGNVIPAASKSAMPGDLVALGGGVVGEHAVDEGGAAEVLRLLEGAAEVLWILNKEALAAEGFHDPVVPRAVNQCVGLHFEHRAFRDLRHAGADAA